VDPERGGVPPRLRDEIEAAGLTIDIAQDDLRQIPNRGWLPFAMTMYTTDGRARRLLVQNQECDTPVSKDFMGLAFKPPVGVQDRIVNVVYQPQDYWHLDKLPGPNSPKAAAVTRGDMSPPILAGEREPGTWNAPMFTISAAAVLALIAVIGGLRARRPGRAG
jgi:hypothetical protein